MTRYDRSVRIDYLAGDSTAVLYVERRGDDQAVPDDDFDVPSVDESVDIHH